MREILPDEALRLVIINEFKKELVEHTKNYGIKKTPTGTTHALTLSFEGSIYQVINSNGKNTWGAKESVRLYYLAREAWLKGDFESVADLFGVLV